MPVLGGSTPTVSVNVPVPTPVAPPKSRTPVSFGPPPQAPQPVPAQPILQPQQPVPGPRAIIFPWSPSPKKMSRLPRKVVRYAAPPEQSQLSRRSSTLSKKVIRYGSHDSLPGLLKSARSDPYDTTVHGAIADALDEAHPGNHIGELIRRQYGLGQHTKPQRNHYTFPFNHGADEPTMGVPIGNDGPFQLTLDHGQNGVGNSGAPPKWIVTADTRLTGPGTMTSYTFEFPHEEAHLIPQMFPGAAEHVSGNTGLHPNYRNAEAEAFNADMGNE